MSSRPESGFTQGALFADDVARRRVLPVLGEQSDIRYYGAHARSVLNGPEVTGMGFWSVNPYVGCAFGCTYCYARYAHRYVLERSAAANPGHEGIATDLASFPPWLAFERRIFVKENAPELLRRTLRFGSEKHLALVRGDTVVIGTATDPYQPAERRFRVTRGVLEALTEHAGLSVVIITKSPLVTRDVDVLRRIARNSKLSVHLSLITLDRELARRIEPRAPTPDSRLRALTRLRESGVRVEINVMPVLPGITDEPNGLERLVREVALRGAERVNAGSLRLRRAARERYLPFIAQEFPELESRYRATYAFGHSAGARYRNGLAAFFRRTCARYGIAFGDRRDDRDDGEDPDTETSVVTPPAAIQLSLAL